MREFDLAILRAFVLIADGRSFIETARLVGRSPSAVTLQIKKLEDAIDAPVLSREGRQVTLTLAGERLLSKARRLLAINDDAVRSLTRRSVRPLAFGVTQDLADAALASVLTRFAAEHPDVQLTSIRVQHRSPAPS